MTGVQTCALPIYAVSQGTLAVGGFSIAGAAETIVKGVPTSGRIANGAIIERQIPFELAQLGSVKLSLRNPDFTTARSEERRVGKECRSRWSPYH